MSKRSESSACLNDLLARVASHMRMKYRVGLDEIEITDTPGYWRDKKPKMHPGHPLHSCLDCDGPFRATYTYFDPSRERGQFVSPTRTWAALRDNPGGKPPRETRSA